MDIEDCIDYASNIVNVDEALAELEQINTIIVECENALSDYVDRLEKQGGIMGYGNKVLSMCRAYLALHPRDPK